MKSWLLKLATKGKKAKIKPRTKPDKSELDLVKSELNIAKAKAKSVSKLAKDVKASPHLFREGKAFKEGLGKFGSIKPSGKK